MSDIACGIYEFHIILVDVLTLNNGGSVDGYSSHFPLSCLGGLGPNWCALSWFFSEDQLPVALPPGG